MHTLKVSRFVLLATGLAMSGLVLAQDDASDRADVWSVVEAQWNAVEKGDDKWTDDFLVDEFSGWQKNSPAPRNKSSTQMWDRFNETQGSMVAHELYPLAITVYQDMAIAHYFYTSAYRDKDGDVEVNNGRFSDVLVRTKGGWKFIAWHGGDDK